VSRQGITDKLASEQLEDEGASQANLRTSVLEEELSCSGAWVGACLLYLKNSNEASVVGER
jgi:hypothetical protein